MEKQLIDQKAEELSSRITGINNWIKQNPNTDPNFYEIMDVYVECSSLVAEAAKYYEQVGYPTYEEEGQTKTRNHYQICSFDEKVGACWQGLREMLTLRRLDRQALEQDQSSTNFGCVEEVDELFTELSYRGSTGEYHTPENPVMAQMKKEILCKSVSIPFYIWQVQRQEPDYKYDNVQEFDKLKDDYDMYKRAVGTQVVIHGESTYQGPQFGNYIEALIDRIEKSYKFSEVYTSGNQY